MMPIIHHKFVIDTAGRHEHLLGDLDLRESKPRGLSTELLRAHPTEEQRLLEKTSRTKLTTTPNFLSTRAGSRLFDKEYGRCKEILHYGHHSTVRLHRKTSNETCAVKITRQSRSYKSTKPDPFQEIHNLLSYNEILTHTNLVRIHDSFMVPEGDHYLIMDYCEGHDLGLLCLTSTGNRLAREEADCFFRQMIHGVNFLHSQGLAHCNLSPANILLTRTGCVKIAALETLIPCLTSPERPRELNHQRLRPPFHIPRAYVAPEHFSSLSDDLRPGDVWGAGLIYLFMRTGKVHWAIAIEEEDLRYQEYVKGRVQESFEPIESLGLVSRGFFWFFLLSAINIIPQLGLTIVAYILDYMSECDLCNVRSQ